MLEGITIIIASIIPAFIAYVFYCLYKNQKDEYNFIMIIIFVLVTFYLIFHGINTIRLYFI